jgi:hypothetical protein
MNFKSTKRICSLHLICAHYPRVLDFIGKPDPRMAAATNDKPAVPIAAREEADPKRGLSKPL